MVGVVALILVRRTKGRVATVPPISGLRTQDTHISRGLIAPSMGIKLAAIGRWV